MRGERERELPQGEPFEEGHDQEKEPLSVRPLLRTPIQEGRNVHVLHAGGELRLAPNSTTLFVAAGMLWVEHLHGDTPSKVIVNRRVHARGSADPDDPRLLRLSPEFPDETS